MASEEKNYPEIDFGNLIAKGGFLLSPEQYKILENAGYDMSGCKTNESIPDCEYGKITYDLTGFRNDK